MSQEISLSGRCAGAEATSPPASRGAVARFLSIRNWPLLALLLYFAGRLVFFAVGIAPSVPPDEVTHFGKSWVYSNALLFPDDSPQSYEYGLVTNIPWLYYFVMGKLLLLNVGVSDLLFLRLCNIPMAFGTLWFSWRMLRLLTEDRLAEFLLVVLMTNTLMFSFLSASVSYDNLTNLLAAASLFYLFSFFKEGSGTHLALSFLCQLAGCLTKTTFLPLFALMSLSLLVHEWRRLPGLPGALADYFRSAGRRGMVLAGAIVLAALLNLQLYGGNLLRYHHLEVETYDVLPLEQAMKYRLAARSYIFEEYRAGHVTLEKAKEMTALVNHPGDRKDTLTLLQNRFDMEKRGERLMGLAPYTALWILHMLESTFGIKAHLGMCNSGFTFLPLTLFILAATVAIALRCRPRDHDYIPLSMALIAWGYGAILMYEVNYRTYVVYWEPILSVAGRYMFPVLAPLYVLASWCLMRLFPGEKARLALLFACALTFIVCDFPFFLSHATLEWFGNGGM